MCWGRCPVCDSYSCRCRDYELRRYQDDHRFDSYENREASERVECELRDRRRAEDERREQEEREERRAAEQTRAQREYEDEMRRQYEEEMEAQRYEEEAEAEGGGDYGPETGGLGMR